MKAMQMRWRHNNFLNHFARGAVIAFKSSDGAGACGHLLDADDRGIYIDMADGGKTFFAWALVSHVWDGPPAQRAIKQRNERRGDPEVAAMRDAIRGMLGDYDEEPAPALSEEEIEELLKEAPTGHAQNT